MRILLVGATGGTGRRLLEEALERRHEVVALVRQPGRLRVEHDRLRVVGGSADDRGAVEAAIEGCEAVVSALGTGTNLEPTTVMSDAMRTLVPAAERAGCRRFVYLSAAGAGDSAAKTSFLARHTVVFLLRHVLADHDHSESILRKSSLEWIIVRPPRLMDGKRTQRYRHGDLELGLTAQVSRADVAHFMIEQLDEPTYVGQHPIIAQ